MQDGFSPSSLISVMKLSLEPFEPVFGRLIAIVTRGIGMGYLAVRMQTGWIHCCGDERV